jgi:hypothetical protein
MPYSDLEVACPGIRYFTWLRDPVARYLSHYKNKARSYTREDFDRWTSAEWTHDFQAKTLAGAARPQEAIDLMASKVGFVGLTEYFDESLLMLRQWLAEPAFRPEYQPVNQLAVKSRTRDVARAHTDTRYLDDPAARERLREINAIDQRVYDFARHEMFERQRQAYIGDLAADVTALRERNRQLTDWSEPLSSRLLRNWVYKPALALRLA